jgi:hypothetical protein
MDHVNQLGNNLESKEALHTRETKLHLALHLFFQPFHATVLFPDWL